MKNILFDAVILFFIAYAILDILKACVTIFIRRFSKVATKGILVLPLDNGEDCLECKIRTAIAQSVNAGCALVIIDNFLNSSEKMILWRIADNYENVIISPPDKISEILTQSKGIESVFEIESDFPLVPEGKPDAEDDADSNEQDRHPGSPHKIIDHV